MRDLDVRLAVRRRLDELHFGDADTRIVEEMGVWAGSVRIDIAVINGELCGFELKSDSDTLERLPAQEAIYSRVFDRVELVVGQRHAAKAEAIVPAWWGIMIASELSGGVCLALKRQAGISPSRDAKLIAHLLWKDEAVAVLDSFGLATGWRSKPVRLLHERLACGLPFDDLRQAVRGKLKARVKWLGKPSSNKLNMSIDGDLNPFFRVSGTNVPNDDLVNSNVPPTVTESASTGVPLDSLRMTEELRRLRSTPWAVWPHTATD